MSRIKIYPIKYCKHCNKQFKRKKRPNGDMECYWEFMKRTFCNPSCAMKYRVGVDKVKYVCKRCGKKFIDYASNRKGSKNIFCSPKCSSIYRFKDKSICSICGKKVRLSRNVFCSRECRGKSQRKGSIVTCQICNKKYYLPLNRIVKTKIFYCSRKCRKLDYDKLCEKMRMRLREMRLSNGETLPERIVREILESQDVCFEKEKKIGRYFIDFYISNIKLCIEVDGDYWHGNKNTNKYIKNINQEYAIKRDLEKKKFLEKNGYKLLRFWEYDIKNNRGDVYDNIKKAIQ